VGLDQKPARRTSRARRGLRAATVSTCRRRAASSAAAVSSSSAAVLICSCCASIYQTSARSRGWRSELALHRGRQLICPLRAGPGRRSCWLSACRRPGIPNAPGSTPRRQLSVFGLFSLLFATIEGSCTGGRAPVSGAFAAAALLLTAFVPWELRSSHPMLDPRFFRIPASRHEVGHYHRSSSSWRHVTMVQRRSRSRLCSSRARLPWSAQRAGYMPGPPARRGAGARVDGRR
jgi:hypothetical protein